MSAGDKAISILHATHDGDDLAPCELSLLESAVNGWLTKEGKVAFDDLHRRVESGEYRKPWLFEVEHLTLDHDGYVYWRDKQVEHFTFYDDAARRSLRTFSVKRLGPACRRIEVEGREVTCSSVMKALDEKTTTTPRSLTIMSTATLIETKSIADQVDDLTRPLLTHHFGDSDIDRELIDGSPGTKFLHWSRLYGTRMTLLFETEDLPARGEHIPFLFGTADRHHIVKGVVSIAEHYTNPYTDRPLLVLHFDGRRLHEITAERAVDIAKSYRHRLETEWRTR